MLIAPLALRGSSIFKSHPNKGQSVKMLDTSHVRSVFQTALAFLLVTLLHIPNTPLTHAQSADVWFGTKKAGNDGMELSLIHI